MVYRVYDIPEKIDHGKVFFSLPEVGKYARPDANCH